MTDIDACMTCEGAPKLGARKGPVAASIWNGGGWEEITHYRRQCKRCNRTYRLDYYLEKDDANDGAGEVGGAGATGLK